MTMATITQPTTTPGTGQPRRTNWLAWLSAALLVLGLAAGFLVGRVTKADPPSDLANATITKMLDDYAQAVNGGDVTTIKAFFTPNATMTDTTRSGGYTVQGDTKIAEAIASWHTLGFEISKGGTAIVNGDLVAQKSNSVVGPAMAVYQISGGKFLNIWMPGRSA